MPLCGNRIKVLLPRTPSCPVHSVRPVVRCCWHQTPLKAFFLSIVLPKLSQGLLRTNQPVTRAVREMSAEELVAAINLHLAALDERDVRPLDRLDRLLRLVARRPAVRPRSAADTTLRDELRADGQTQA
jgi:hypothetical protein